MGNGLRHTDTDPGWISRRFRDLDRRLNELAAAKRLPGTEVAEGTSFLVRGILSVVGLLDVFGTVSMKTEDNAEIVRIGDMEYGRGFELKRDDGSIALSFRKFFSTTDQQGWVLTDRDGIGIVEQAGVSRGLGKPVLEYPFQPVAATSGTAVTCGPYGWERTTSSGSFVTLFAYDGKAQNPFLDFKFAVICSDGTTAGEMQVVDLNTGVPQPGFLSAAWLGNIPTGTTTLTILDPTPNQVLNNFTNGVGGQVRLGIQVRRTAGAGSITLSVAQSIGG